MIRNYTKAFVVMGLLGMVGACADNTAAPTMKAPSIVAPANFTETGTQVVFSVNNAEGILQRIGNHVLYIPAGAICDLATSSYGAGTWDAPCDPLVGSVTITATVLEDDDLMPYVDFQPAMRFEPTKEVMVFVRQGKNTPKKLLQMFYCNQTAYCFDESVTDASLKPFRVGNTPVIGRRIKHFSGYMVTSGPECPTGILYDNGDGTYWCEDDGGGFQRRSGYMVASGVDLGDVIKENEENRANKKKDEQ